MNERKARIGLRLVSLLLAGILWVVVATERTANQSVRVVEAALTFDIPGHLILIDPPRTLNVRLSGSTDDVKNLNPQMVGVVVDLMQVTEPGSLDVPLRNDNVFIPGDLEVVAVEPGSIRLTLDQVESRQLPLRVELSGEPAAGATLMSYQTEPGQVMATGPRSVLETLTSLPTAAVNLDGHALSFAEEVEVRPENLLVTTQPRSVRVAIELQPPSLPDTPPLENESRG